MKITFYKLFTFISIFCTLHSPTQAQDVIQVYHDRAGEYSYLYNGKVELNYSNKLYENLPYYKSSDFVEGIITLKNNNQSKELIRLDLFKERLILISPKKFNVIANPDKIAKINVYDKTFFWLSPPKGNKMKTGFYISLVENPRITLLCKEDFILNKKEITRSNFDLKTNYYILLENRYIPVKNKDSFLKLFPEYKLPIQDFIKSNKLNFDQDKEQSFIMLTSFCKELITP